MYDNLHSSVSMRCNNTLVFDIFVFGLEWYSVGPVRFCNFWQVDNMSGLDPMLIVIPYLLVRAFCGLSGVCFSLMGNFLLQAMGLCPPKRNGGLYTPNSF